MSDEILGFGFQATRTPHRVSRISYPASRMGSHVSDSEILKGYDDTRKFNELQGGQV
jgi:hypothetical protein